MVRLEIKTIEHLRTHLKVLKMRLIKEGCNELQLYPMFVMYYEKNKERYQLSKEIVLDSACEILIEDTNNNH